MSDDLVGTSENPPACPTGGERAMTMGEVELASSIFGAAIDYSKVTLRRRKWAFFQPRNVTMAPRGHLHFHPRSSAYCDDFSHQSTYDQGLLIHELTHVWQTQTRGSWYLVCCRPFSSRYDYSLKPGWKLEQYGIEQQAEIVKHAFWLRNGLRIAGATDPAPYDMLVNFPGARRRQH